MAVQAIDRVVLDDTLLDVAQRLAETRHDTFAHSGYESTAYGKSSYDVHLIGAKAEVAVSDYYGLLVDMNKRLRGDEHDFEALYQGHEVTIDVKATTYSERKLLVRQSKTDSDYYLNTYVDGPDATTVELVGWAGRPALLDGHYKPSPAGSHRNYVLWPDEMEQIPHPSELTEIQ